MGHRDHVRRAAQPRRARPGLRDRRRLHRRRRRGPGARRQHLLRHGPGHGPARPDRRAGRAHLRPPRQRAHRVRRRRVRRRQHGDLDRGEAGAPAFRVRRARPVLLRQRRRRDRPQPHAQPPRRARDHRRQRGLPAARRPHRHRAPARHRLVRHGDLRGPDGRQPVRARRRGAAGLQDRLRRGDRLAGRLARRRRPSAGSATSWSSPGTAPTSTRAWRAAGPGADGDRGPVDRGRLPRHATPVPRRARGLPRVLPRRPPRRAPRPPPRHRPDQRVGVVARHRARHPLRRRAAGPGQVRHGAGRLTRRLRRRHPGRLADVRPAGRRSPSTPSTVGRSTSPRGWATPSARSRTAPRRCTCARPATTRRAEHGIHPLDGEVGLALPPGVEPLLSPKDDAAPSLAHAAVSGRLPTYAGCTAWADTLAQRSG